MIYLSLDIVIGIHARILEAEPAGIETSPGILHAGVLESILLRMREKVYGEDFLPDIHTKAAYLLKAINDFHPFVDGNKRTSILSTAYFLLLNGYWLEAETENELEVTRDAAMGTLNLVEIAVWLESSSVKMRRPPIVLRGDAEAVLRDGRLEFRSFEES
ncbi:MAG: type II toxin-antitoxin system death-on-curing family toxin [Candidatus Thermoplasmatota archaeon]|nr:type II toxin-antitoxin system death-on-curing family toxin [Candidatus Thermoplasmatota archaeon]